MVSHLAHAHRIVPHTQSRSNDNVISHLDRHVGGIFIVDHVRWSEDYGGPVRVFLKNDPVEEVLARPDVHGSAATFELFVVANSCVFDPVYGVQAKVLVSSRVAKFPRHHKL